MEYMKKEYGKRGNPFKRGKSWTYVYYVTNPDTGKKVQKYKGGFQTKKEAEESLKETEAKILMGVYVEDSKTLLKDYILHWFEEIHRPTLKAKTINGYRRNIEAYIIPELGNKRLTELRRTDIQRFYNSLVSDKGLNPTTVRYIHNVLRKAMSESVINDLLVKSPCAGIKLPKKRKFRATVLDKQQAKYLLEVIKGSDCEMEVLLAITLGLRRGEALGVRFQDFDFEKQTVHICQQVTTVHDREYLRDNPGATEWGITEVKTDDGNREIYVPKSVPEAVQKRREQVEANKREYGTAYIDHDLVCCCSNGDMYCPNNASARFKKLLKKTPELPQTLRFHDLRHSCATVLLEEDVPLKVISNLLGHSSIKVTGDIYCDVLEKKKQPAQVVEDVFFA